MKPLKKQRKVLALAGIAIVVGAFLYFGTHSKTLSSKDVGSDKSLSQVEQQAKEAATQSDSQKTSSTGQSSQPADSGPGSGSGQAPTSPTGEFVSAHTVPSSAAISSICNTSIGASCQIVFTRTDGVSKSLASQAVDSSGSTHWDWTAGDLLDPGTWSIKAVATKNGQSSSTSDAGKLVVQ